MHLLPARWVEPWLHGPWPDHLPIANDGPTIPTGPVRLLVWNLQYAAGRRYHFFYDGGQDVAVARSDVERNLAAIANTLASERPDFALLQEVDRHSRRTAEIDQHARLVEMGGWSSHTSAPYHRVCYVPVPFPAALGRVDFHLSVLGRHTIRAARRIALPLLNEGWLRRQFNLRRAVLEVDVPLADGGTLRLMNTHLSAFARGDGSLAAQVEVLDARMAQATREVDAWVLAGDLNALPPGDDAGRLGADARDYPEKTSPIAALFDRYQSAIPAAAHAADPEPWRTYLPPGAAAPDRAIDHVFYGGRIDVREVVVLREHAELSDHLPIRLDLTIRPQAPAPG